MALRLLEVLVPGTAGSEVDSMLANEELLFRWQEPTTDQRLMVRLVVEAEKAEPILDLLDQRFGKDRDFGVVILDVQGVLPRPPEPEPDPEAQKQAKAKKKKVAERIAREELLNDMVPGTRINRTYVATVVLSTIVAGVGLIDNSVAVIIGAMVIAPLLTPNMALALATTLGDLDLMRRALRCNLAGLAIATGLALSMGWWIPFAADASEIVSRTSLGFTDVILALASGCAGALAFTTGVSAGLVGVMVAVALLPPLTTAWMLIGAGHYQAGLGALGLLATNIICVNLAAVLTFVLQGVRPRTWWEADKARRATRRATIIWASLLAILVALLVLAA